MQDVVFKGTTYSNVPAINLPNSNGGTSKFVDVTDTTAVASDVASGKIFHLADGTTSTGTNSGGGGSSGTDTSDATLNSGDQMLSGVTAYANGTKYTGTIASRSSSDLTASGGTVTVPAGNYSSQATKSIVTGSFTVNPLSITANPSITVGSDGLITSTVSASTYSTVTAVSGYVDSASGNTVTVSGSDTEQLTTKGATTYTPGTSDQTISSGTYLTGTQTISGDSNLVATNIKAGVSIFGVTGTYSSWTKVAEHTYSNITQTSTTAANIGTWDTGHSEIWTSNKILYLRIRDTAGKRSGYFYGTDVWFLNMYPKNESTAENASNGMLMNIWAVTSGGAYSHRYGYSTTGYGVYPNLIYKTGKIRFAARYNSTYSLTINGNYKIEAYLLDPAGGVSIFT